MTSWNRNTQQPAPWGQQQPVQRQVYRQQAPAARQQGAPQVGSSQARQSAQPYGAYRDTQFRPGQAQSQQSPYAQATPYGGYQPRANPQYGYQRPRQPQQYGNMEQMPVARDFEQEFRDAGMPGYDPGGIYPTVVRGGWANPGMEAAYKNWMRQQQANGYPMPAGQTFRPPPFQQAPNNTTFRPLR